MAYSLASALIAAALVYTVAPRIQELPSTSDDSEVRLPKAAVQAASGGYEAVLADWYWIDAIHYYGTPGNEAEHYKHLAGYVETATDLDPEFDYLYQFASVTVPQNDPETHKWHNTEAAIQLAKKGMASHSKRWQIPFGLGYLLFTFRGNYAEAGHYMEEAAKRPGAPLYIPSLAARLLAQGNSVETAILFTKAELDRTEDQRTHDDLEDHLKSLYLQQALEKLNSVAAELTSQGLHIQAVEDLIGHGGIQYIPDEPFGGSFAFKDGRVVSSNQDRLLHMYVHPGEAALTPYAD